MAVGIPSIPLGLSRNSLEMQILGLFVQGEQGAWYDPSDMNSMWQEAAGTTPAVVGQPVGKINDKSGRGNHATQATAASRPTLLQDASGRNYLSFDGVDNGMATAAINFTATDKMTVWAGVHKASDAAAGMVVELSADSNTNNGTFNVSAPSGAAANNANARSKGTVIADASSGAIHASPTSIVITSIGDISGDVSAVRTNGVLRSTAVTDQGTGNFGNYPVYIGRRGGTTLPFNGRIYSLIVRGAASTASQIAAAERYVAGKLGVSL